MNRPERTAMVFEGLLGMGRDTRASVWKPCIYHLLSTHGIDK